MPDKAKTHPEQHSGKSVAGLNALRAAVLGANDGIVSVAGIVAGVAGATNTKSTIFTAGLAGLVAGALSMAAGEYISVSSQRDTEQAILHRERYELENFPEEEFEELVGLYEAKGLSEKTARKVAKELTEHDVFRAHAEAELKIDPDDLTNAWHAAIASAGAFTCGAIIPLLAVTLSPQEHRFIITFVSVLFALVLTGVLSAKASRTNKLKATIRVVIGGVLAMAVTFAIGKLVGTSVA